MSAAALATGSSCKAIASAADEAGDINKTLKMSAMTRDVAIGDDSTEAVIIALNFVRSGVVTAAAPIPVIPPASTALIGMTIMSNFVFPVMRFPTYTATAAASNALIG